MKKELVSLILVAGGKGTRMKSSIPKQFLPLNGKPIVCHSLEVFLSIPEIHDIIVVCEEAFHSIFSSYSVIFAPPGERRQDSVYSGLQKVSPDSHWICVHDAARPFITSTMVHRLFEEGKKTGAATVGMPVKWTVKTAGKENLVDATLARDKVWEIQTPQFLRKQILQKGFEIAFEKQVTVTDDVSLAELATHPVKLVEGSYTNLKITTPEDIAIAEQFLKATILSA